MDKTPRRLSRRAFILTAGSALVLTACATAPAPAATSTTAPQAGATTAAPTATRPAATPGSTAAGPTATPVAAARNLADFKGQIVLQARPGAETDMFEKRIPQFMEKYPNVKVTYDQPGPDYFTALETRLASGTDVGDVFFTLGGNFTYQEYTVRGLTRQLDELIRRDNFDINQFYPEIVKGLRSVDNKVFGLPLKGQQAWLFLFYNADMLGEAGIKEPDLNWTTDTLRDAAIKLTKRSGNEVTQYGYSVAWEGAEQVIAWLRRHGGNLYTPDGKKTLFAEKASLDAMQWHYDLAYKQQALYFPNQKGSTLGGDLPKLMGEGRIAMLGNQLQNAKLPVKTNTEGKFKWGMTLMPKGPTGTRGAFQSFDPMVIYSQTKNVDASWELIKWVTNRESGIALTQQKSGSLTPGGRPDVYCSPEVLNDPNFPKVVQQTICDGMNNGETYSFPHNFKAKQINDILGPAIVAIRDGEEPTKGFAEEAARKIQAVLDEAR